jgi:homoserine kinase
MRLLVGAVRHRRAKAPASSANLGPGFDALAIALGLYVEVEVLDRPRGLAVVAQGEGSGLPGDGSHLAARVVAEVLGHDRFEVRVRSEVPVARGLGSSAALAVASAAAAGAGVPQEAFEHGYRVDGHPENAAAAAYGGLVAAAVAGGRPLARRLVLDPTLRFVVIVPERELATSHARGVLPEAVSLEDAAFNLGRMGLLVAGLADRAQLVPEAGEDRLHQAYRSSLFPQAEELLEALRSSGALTSCWSGAGPSLLGICEAGDEEQVAAGARAAMARLGVAGEVLVLEEDRAGVQVEEVAEGTGGRAGEL